MKQEQYAKPGWLDPSSNKQTNNKLKPARKKNIWGTGWNLITDGLVDELLLIFRYDNDNMINFKGILIFLRYKL